MQTTYTKPILVLATDEDLIRRTQAGDTEARDALVERYMPLIYKLAHKYSFGLMWEERVQEGIIGLLNAVKRFDLGHESGMRSWWSYMTVTVEGAIHTAILNQDRTIRLPEHLGRKTHKLDRALEAGLSVTEAAQAIDESVASVTGMLNRTISGHTLVNDEDELIETVGEWDSYELGMAYELEAAMALLADRDRDLVLSRVIQGQSYKEIAGEVGLSHHTVKRIVEESLNKLRSAMGYEEPEPVDWKAQVLARLEANPNSIASELGSPYHRMKLLEREGKVVRTGKRTGGSGLAPVEWVVA